MVKQLPPHTLRSPTIQVRECHSVQSPGRRGRKTLCGWVGTRTICPSRLHSVALGQMNQHVYLLMQLSSFEHVMHLKGNKLFSNGTCKIQNVFVFRFSIFS